MPVNLRKAPRIYIAGTINKWNNDPDDMVRAEMNENGPEQVHGWIDPDWSMWQVHESRRDVRPDVYDFDDFDPDFPDTTIAAWVAKRVAWHIGAIDSADVSRPGEAVFYAADAYTDLRHDERSDTDDDVSLSAIVTGIDVDTLNEIIALLESQQCIKIS